MASLEKNAYIPSKEHIHSTSDVDGVNTSFGYWGPLSYPMRRRLDMAVISMKKKNGYKRIFDAGYGCGIMLPDLYKRLAPDGRLYGVDIHNEVAGVMNKMVKLEGMDAGKVELHSGSLEKLPFPDKYFDLIVSISVLEHISPELLPACLTEIKRVAAPGAEIIIGFPTYSLFIKMLSLIQGTNLKINHPATHNDIFTAVHSVGFHIKSQSGFPACWGPFTMHYNLRLEDFGNVTLGEKNEKP